ncbi:hypothetical protein [Roseovarius litoreus]|uniref:hypothetical protein n=1 Tax=Roseovarius litoreus TaxID=1155722 RepID=UPI00122C8C9B|nr:hypothetical protein [Roseovarius litoreus]
MRDPPVELWGKQPLQINEAITQFQCLPCKAKKCIDRQIVHIKEGMRAYRPFPIPTAGVQMSILLCPKNPYLALGWRSAYSINLSRQIFEIPGKLLRIALDTAVDEERPVSAYYFILGPLSILLRSGNRLSISACVPVATTKENQSRLDASNTKIHSMSSVAIIEFRCAISIIHNPCQKRIQSKTVVLLPVNAVNYVIEFCQIGIEHETLPRHQDPDTRDDNSIVSRERFDLRVLVQHLK